MAVPSIASPEELYAHAIAIEREASERYAEFAGLMADLGHGELAAVFTMLAGFEAEHLDTLTRRTEGISLPALAPEEHRWLDNGAPETAAHESIHRLITPYQALGIALEAEKRAHRFFLHVFHAAGDPALRALSQEMAAEEREHIALVEREMARTPSPQIDCSTTGDNGPAPIR